MKKLSLLAAIVATGFAQAAQLSWEQSAFIKNPGGSSGSLTSGTIYLVDANIGISQDSLWGQLYAQTPLATALQGKALATGSIGSNSYLGNVVGGTYNTERDVWDFPLPSGVSAGMTLSVYQVVQVDDIFYFSEVIEKGVDALSGAIFLYENSNSKNEVIELGPLGGISPQGGWYAVPEPTSGLLMLVGLSLLGLRRKRRE